MNERGQNSVALSSFKATLVVVSVLVLFWAIYLCLSIFIVFFIAVILALFLGMLTDLFSRLRVNRKFAYFLSLFSIFSIGALIGIFVVPAFLKQGSELISGLPVYLRSIVDKLNELSNKSDYLSPVSEMGFTIKYLGKKLADNAPMCLGSGVSILFQGISGVVNVIAIIILGIYLSMNPQGYVKSISGFFGGQTGNTVYDILMLMGQRLKGWITGQLVSTSFICVAYSITFIILGLPQAFFLGFLAGGMSFIPYIGTFFGILIPTILAFSIAPVKALWVLIMYAVIQLIQDYVVTPTLMKNRVNMPPVLTILSFLVFSGFFGFWGVIIALPLSACLMVLFEELWLLRLKKEAVSPDKDGQKAEKEAEIA
jgi:predicted PurR-regulated permease PerM